MRHLKTFSLFESAQELSEDQIYFLNRSTQGLGSWSINPTTGLVDINGDFDGAVKGLKDFKGIRFGEVTGFFDCSTNNLESLEGAPETVGGDFDCSENLLQNLKGAPKTVGGDFECDKNSLQSLEGAPETVGENFQCYDNSLQNLKGAPKTVGGSFDCSHNSLQTLEGAPKTVGGFNCSHNSLQTLEGSPQIVGRFFDCSYNHLQTLEGAPEKVGGWFSSDDVYIKEGNWTVPSLAKEYLESGGKEKDLLGTLKTLISPEALQKEIDENPEKMSVELTGNLKGLLELPEYQSLKFPTRLQKEVGLLRDLSGVGL